MDVKITPYKHGDGGTICMPLVSNVPEANLRHPDWKLTVCPACGEACWETELCRELLEQQTNVQAACTMCAVKQGLEIRR